MGITKPSSAQLEHQPPGAGAIARQVGAELSYVTPEDFGAVGNGVADDTAPLQAMIDYLETVKLNDKAAGGIGYLPPGKKYGISIGLTINKPIKLRGAGYGQDSGGATGASSDAVTMIVALATFAGGSMLRVIASAAGAILAGGELSGFTLHGSNLADYGVRMSSCQSWIVDVGARNCITAGVRSDNDNAALSKGNEFSVGYSWGTVAATQGSHALWINGTDGYGHPQNIIHRCSGLVSNGTGLRIQGNVDNCIIEHVGVVLQGGGTGYNLAFLNASPGTSAPRSNVVHYCAGGKVLADSSSRANRILAMTSEAGEVTIIAGGQLHYAVVDYQTSGLWDTERFRLSDRHALPVTSLRADGTNATEAVAALLWPCISFADAVTGWCGGSIARKDWSAGTITSLELRFVTDTANTAKAVRLRLRAVTKGSGAGISTAEEDENFTVAVNDSANVLTVATITFATPLPIAVADSFLFRLERLGADAADTMLGAWQLLGIGVNYVSNGPVSAGSGPYTVGPVGS